ncbi:Lpg1974 family pore-forming outer membrane protein [Rhodopseudomonas palustris]|uniref:Porin n=1 Tax=Rhodopseudomonas palustris (strain BisB18) TaxID=316056 RepID=Q21BQ4_RHOPB
MTPFTKPALLIGLALTASTLPQIGHAASAEEQITARLNALEKENAGLRARLNRLETAKAAKPMPPAPQNTNLAAMPQRPVGEIYGKAPVAIIHPAPRQAFEVSGSLLLLQSASGNMEYATLINPLPLVSPHWNNQALEPDFAAAFDLGARYMNGANDIAVQWTHLKATTNASFEGTPDQMVGPPYLIGPESALYKVGRGSLQAEFDSVKMDVGHTFCVDCDFQMRAFGGVEFARIGQDLTGTAESRDASASSSYTNHSKFTGAGPRIGVKSQYSLGSFDFSGEIGGAALIGTMQSRVDYLTVKPALAQPTVQYLASPNATRVIPSVNARLATAYNFAPTAYGLFKVEVGYQAAVYFDAVGEYAVTQVPTSLVLPPNGVYLATAQHLTSNFTTHGPFMTAKWQFQ